jgi:hypothetical protein
MTIRISRSTHALLHELAMASGLTMSQVVDEAARELRNKRFWKVYHASYSALESDPDALIISVRSGAVAGPASSPE